MLFRVLRENCTNKEKTKIEIFGTKQLNLMRIRTDIFTGERTIFLEAMK